MSTMRQQQRQQPWRHGRAHAFTPRRALLERHSSSSTSSALPLPPPLPRRALLERHSSSSTSSALPLPPPLVRRAGQVAASCVLSALAMLGGGALGASPAAAAAADGAAAAPPLYDGARVLASQQQPALVRQLEELEAAAGWKVRVYTGFGGPGLKSADAPSPRALWGAPDARTLVVVVDPSSPNILNLTYIGDDVLLKLRRPFLQEVQSRFGNIFNVRDNGADAAVMGAVGALTSCLAAPEGCKVVPGLPADQYYFTLAFSVAGGVVAGFVSRLPAQGVVRRQWVWLLIFSPLWASLFVNFGLGPVVSRTSDVAPVLLNCAGFAAGAAATYLDRILGTRGGGDAGDGGSSGDGSA